MSAAVALVVLLACGAKAPPHAPGGVAVTAVERTEPGLAVKVHNDGPGSVEVVRLDVGLWDADGPSSARETYPGIMLPVGTSHSLPVEASLAEGAVRISGTVHVRDPLGTIDLIVFDRTLEPR